MVKVDFGGTGPGGVFARHCWRLFWTHASMWASVPLETTVALVVLSLAAPRRRGVSAQCQTGVWWIATSPSDRVLSE